MTNDIDLMNAMDKLFDDNDDDDPAIVVTSTAADVVAQQAARAVRRDALRARQQEQPSLQEQTQKRAPLPPNKPTKRSRRPKKAESADDGDQGGDIPLNPMALPADAAMSRTMIRQRDIVASELTRAVVEIEEHRQIVIQRGVLAPSSINISTITLECDIVGPNVPGDDMKTRMGHPDVVEFNDMYLGKQPHFGGAKKAFNNSHILLLHDVRPKNNMSVKVFHPKPKLHITGPTNVDEFMVVAEYARRLLTAVCAPLPSDTPLFMLDDFRVQMINTNFKLGDKSFKISIKRMHDLLKSLSIDAYFDAGIYAGIKIKRKSLNSKHAWIMVFESGNVLITSCAGSSILESYRFITDFVTHYIEQIRHDDFEYEVAAE